MVHKKEEGNYHHIEKEGHAWIPQPWERHASPFNP